MKQPLTARSFFSINLNEVVFDSGMILYAFFISSFVLHNRPVVSVLSPPALIVLYLTICFVMPSYMGVVFGRYREVMGQAVQKIVFGVFSLITLLILIFLTVLMGDLRSGEEGQGFLLTSGIAMILMGGIAGMIGAFSAEDSSPATAAAPSAEEDFGNPIVAILMVTVAVLVLFYLGIYKPFGISFDGFTGILMFLLVFFGSPLAGLLFMAALVVLHQFLIRIGLGPALDTGKHILIPLLIVFVLICFNDISTRYLLSVAHTIAKGSSTAVLLSLTLSGLIPYRLILIFTPPFRVLNLLLGLAAFGLFIFHVL